MESVISRRSGYVKAQRFRVSSIAVAAADFIHESRHSFRVKTLSESAVIGLQPSLDVRNWDDVRSQFVVRTFEQSINFAS